MAIHVELQYARLQDLYLDTKNPRLARHHADADLSQEEVLDLMLNWVLEELAVSYLESGFWTHEALLVVQETLYGQLHLVVVEGNRRLAALKYLYDAVKGKDVPQKWKNLIKNTEVPQELFNRIPYIKVDSRQEIESFLGFRHVTGIKQWPPEQKAQYITKLIDDRDMSYVDVMRKIGSNTPTVRQHYISYRLLLQMEDSLDDFSVEYAQGRFSVMYLSLRTQGVQTYLDIDIYADPETAQKPVPETHLDALSKFALWLFGNQQQPPLFTDSRRVDDFGRILENSQAVQYLEQNSEPNFDYAFQLAGGDESEIVQLFNTAATNVQLALSRVHHYKDSEDI
ncbi:MAG: hypothetical protein OXU23_27595, partial [Candidatus Poribacteria bacterium]|nr:hypothetical protein [Candidatus Poribacteria bacterium]